MILKKIDLLTLTTISILVFTSNTKNYINNVFVLLFSLLNHIDEKIILFKRFKIVFSFI